MRIQKCRYLLFLLVVIVVFIDLLKRNAYMQINKKRQLKLYFKFK